MIKPEDLRIGNLVSHGVSVCRVTSIFISHFRATNIVTNIDHGDSIRTNYNPIPLTEKILLDSGFYIDETKNASIMLPNNEVLILELNDKGIYTDYAYGTEIEYLHNLQNLHKELSKTELIIKL